MPWHTRVYQDVSQLGWQLLLLPELRQPGVDVNPTSRAFMA